MCVCVCVCVCVCMYIYIYPYIYPYICMYIYINMERVSMRGGLSDGPLPPQHVAGKRSLGLVLVIVLAAAAVVVVNPNCVCFCFRVPQPSLPTRLGVQGTSFLFAAVFGVSPG